MKAFLKTWSIAFAAGVAGALANSLAVWAGGHFDLTAKLGVKIAPALTAAWLYPRLVWGGIWGLQLTLPLAGMSPWKRGLLISLAPSLVQLFVIFPKGSAGMLGLGLGTLTPLVVLIANAIWGLVTSYWAAKSN